MAGTAVHRLFDPEPLNEPLVGAVVALAASVINLVVAVWLVRLGRRHHSIVLEADGQHLLADVVTSLGVIIGLVLVRATGRWWLDPAVAILVSLNIIRIGWRLLVRSFNGLMDHALPAAEQAKVREAIGAHLEPNTAYHALRTRQAGTDRFVDFHLLVPGRSRRRTGASNLPSGWSPAIRAALPGTEVVIHIEPIEERASWEDSELLALEREQDPRK